MNETDALTCSIDKSLKVWDLEEKECIYTVETHQEIHSMACTGENKDILVASMGEGDLIVFHLVKRNQLAIPETKHTATVTQIVSLSKLQNKYFATRCSEGHCNIWSATNNPDPLFTIKSIDKDENEPEEEQEYLVPSSMDKMIEL